MSTNNFKWTNYHSHTRYSDGKGEAELYVKSAIKHKMYAYGFSCHSPVPFGSGWNMKYENLLEYLTTIKELKRKYSSQIKIFLGMEIDYIKNISGIKNFAHLNLDYTIGGVHFLGFFENGRAWDYDGGKSLYEKGLKELFGGDIKRLVKYYYQQINDMVVYEKPDIIAHLDLIKKYNKNNYFFDETEKWYQNLVLESLEIIAQNNSIVEINTRGVLKGLDKEFYPSNFIINQCKNRNIKICLSADTHHPKDVMALLPDVRKQLLETGFKEVFIFDESGWHPQALQ